MEASLAPARYKFSKLIRHALWSGRAPLHGNIGCRMARGSRHELEIQETLVFAHVVLTKTLGIRRAQDIRDRIMRQMELWERGLHAGLVGDSKEDGAAREGRAASGGEEEEEEKS